MARQQKPIRRFPIEIEIDDKRVGGEYFVDRGMVTVTSVMYGGKSTQVGGSSPAAIARMLLSELARGSRS